MVSEAKEMPDITTPDMPEKTTEELRTQLRLAVDAHRSIVVGGGELSYAKPESVGGALGKNSEYALYIQGLGESPLLRLQQYAAIASGAWLNTPPNVSVSDTELQELTNLMDQIRREAEKLAPDVKKIDELLTPFVEQRLGHLLATLDDRIRVAAKRIDGTWDRDREKAIKMGFPDAAAHEARIRSQIPNLQQLKQQVEGTTKNSRIIFKARFLTDTVTNFSKGLQSAGLQGEYDPFVPGNFREADTAKDVQ